MQIRPLDPGDAAAYQALRLRALLDCPAAFASSHEEECDAPPSTLARQLLASDNSAVLGAFDGPALVGIVGVQREPMRKLAHKAVLWGMYVAPAARRGGTGRQLVAAALACAAAMPGVRQVLLGVNAANPAAIALYEGLGFKAFGVEPGAMLLDGEPHDEMHMVCRVGAA